MLLKYSAPPMRLNDDSHRLVYKSNKFAEQNKVLHEFELYESIKGNKRKESESLSSDDIMNAA